MKARPKARIVRKIRRKLWKQQGGECFWCGIPTVLPEDLLREYVPLDDIYRLGLADGLSALIEQLKTKDPGFRIRWTTELATVDHLIEHALGGTYEEKNLVAACRPCNERRGQQFHETLDDGKP